MAKFENPQKTAAERLRIIISRERGGYNVGRKKWARILGVNERSVERYLQRRGDSKRNIRSSEAQGKINRAFRARMRKDPLFLATYVLEPGESFDVTPWMVDEVGDNVTPIISIWDGGGDNRAPGSVWNTRKPLPRIVFAGGEKMGLGYGRMAVNVRDLAGGYVADGDLRDFATVNEDASNTFGYVDDSDLEIKGRSNDLAVGINNAIRFQFNKIGSSVNIVLAIFDPALAVREETADPETVQTYVRNRRPIVERDSDGKFLRLYWNEARRRRKR